MILISPHKFLLNEAMEDDNDDLADELKPKYTEEWHKDQQHIFTLNLGTVLCMSQIRSDRYSNFRKKLKSEVDDLTSQVEAAENALSLSAIHCS